MRRLGPYYQGAKREVQRMKDLMEELADPNHPDTKFFVRETVGAPVAARPDSHNVSLKHSLWSFTDEDT